MFANKGRLRVTLLVVGVLVVAGGYTFLMPTTIEAHSDNEYPNTDHREVLDSGWAICTPFYTLRKVGDWWVRESCVGVYYSKARWQSYHGKHPCGGCGAHIDSSVHWVSASGCPGGGYYSCVSSGCHQN